MNLSELVSKVVQLHRQADEAYDSIQAYMAPSECGQYIGLNLEKELKELFKRYRITPSQYDKMVIDRTSERVAHFKGLLCHIREDEDPLLCEHGTPATLSCGQCDFTYNRFCKSAQ